jgi:hypothetical protein
VNPTALANGKRSFHTSRPQFPTCPGLGLSSFFNDHKKLQERLRPNSITSYADAMRIFLQFAAEAVKNFTQLGRDDRLSMVYPAS